MSNRMRGRPKGGWVPDAERKPVVAKIRDRHRTIAKLFACGLSRNEVAHRIGMSPERVGQFQNDPAFQNLIAQYADDPDVIRAQGLDSIAFMRGQMESHTQRMMDNVGQQLDEAEAAGEAIPLKDALRAIEIFSDRIGLGKHTTQTHVYDFAAELEHRRIARMKTIEVKVSSQAGPGQPLLLLEGAASASTPAPSGHLGDGDGRGLERPAPSLRRRAL